MVEDNQIKAQVSPFAIREGEIKHFDGKDGYVSMNQIVHKINIGHITDIHFANTRISKSIRIYNIKTTIPNVRNKRNWRKITRQIKQQTRSTSKI